MPDVLALKVRVTWLERFVLLELAPPHGCIVSYAYEDMADETDTEGEEWQA